MIRRFILLSLLILFTGATSTAASPQTNLSPTQRQKYEKDLAHWNVLLDEFHHGKRDDSDAAVILFHITVDHGILGSSATAAALELDGEWNALVQRHPEFKTHKPMHLHEEMVARENRKNAAALLAASEFTPSDSNMSSMMSSDHFAIATYQHHVEFYRLPLEIELINSNPLQWSNGKKNIGVGEMRQLLKQLKPVRTMTFAHHIDRTPPEYVPNLKFLWLCEDFTVGYSASNLDETKILRAKYSKSNGEMPWADTKAEFSDFCGAVSFDGKVIYQLPMKPHDPDALILAAPLTNPLASSVVLNVFSPKMRAADKTSCGEDDCLAAGDSYRELGKPIQRLIYTYPDKLETFSGVDVNKYTEALRAHGFDPAIVQRYGF